tara:strand:- start:8041 stop:9345 length:1305 start_codon:yes stop_codon:yes gene_type:complete
LKNKDKIQDTDTIKVVELFAGVGGFRIGLEGFENLSALSEYDPESTFESPYKVIWSNQFEPSTKVQHATDVYKERFGEAGHSNEDIETVLTDNIPDHDLLVGGFPCQDYSVASTLKNSKGLLGKKGTLWWSIYRILEEKEGKRPKFLMLENVDRLLKSPANQRGRDFAIMLSGLNKLGYAVEWRIINAAEYGMPQRRRRVFILAYHKRSGLYQEIKENSLDWITSKGTIASEFKINLENNPSSFKLSKSLKTLSIKFGLGDKISSFQNTGIMFNGKVTTFKSKEKFNGKKKILSDVLQTEKVPRDFFIAKKDIKQWDAHKGAKKIPRITKDGFEYVFSEGGMVFPDSLDNASRTIITGEGGKSPSRFKHVVQIKGKYRRLTPVELERLNMFPDNHTFLDEISDAKRAFFMGNALVVGVVEKLGRQLFKQIKLNE